MSRAAMARMATMDRLLSVAIAAAFIVAWGCCALAWASVQAISP